MNYYLLEDNINFPNRWFVGPFYLDKPFDEWNFTKIGPLSQDYSGLSIGIREKGLALDFTFADFSIPIITDRTASFIPSSEIQLIRVKAGIFNNYSVMVLMHELDCLDESKSYFTKFDENSARPDLIGQYESIYKIVLDEQRCEGHSIFRIKGYIPAIIINENIKQSFINNNIRGIYFQKIQRAS